MRVEKYAELNYQDVKIIYFLFTALWSKLVNQKNYDRILLSEQDGFFFFEFFKRAGWKSASRVEKNLKKISEYALLLEGLQST